MYKCWDKYLLSADYRRQVNTQERLILFAIVYLHLWKINNNNNQQTVYEVQSGTGRACLYHLQRMRRTPPKPAEPRPSPTAGERGGWTKKKPQMAKSSWPQGRNREFYHRSPRSKPTNTLVPTQHPQEAWRGPNMQTMWPFQWDHWPSGL